VLDGSAIHLRAEILSADGQETVAGEARIARGDMEAAEALGRVLLDRASPALRALFEA